MRIPWAIGDHLLARRVLAARDGDARAMRAVYRELYPEVARFVGRRIRSAADADDLVARVFFAFVEHLDDFDPSRGSVRAWVLRIARNAVIDHVRARRFHADVDALGDLLAGRGDPLDELIEREELDGLVLRLVALPAETRELLTLRYGDGLSLREISTLLGVGEAAVKQRMSRAVRRLRAELCAEPRKEEVDATA